MSKHLLQSLIEFAEYKTETYSGRGMYGAQCLSVDPGPCKYEFIADLIYAAREWIPEDDNDDEALDVLQDALRIMKTDSLGLGTVAYFPGIPYTGKDRGDDEEEDEQEGAGVT